jgi:hypothetical protein
VLLERLPNAVSDQRRCEVRNFFENVLLDRHTPVPEAFRKLVIDCGGFSAHEVIVTSR